MPTTYLRSRLRRIGTAPGALHDDESAPDVSPLRIRATRFASDGTPEVRDYAPTDELPVASEGSVLWIDLIGHDDLRSLKRVARHFGVPDLVLEDAIDVGQRPMFAAGTDWLFLSLRRVWLTPEAELHREQLGLFLRDGLVLTFQEYDGDAWDMIRRRIEDPAATLRSRGADYLWYRLADATVDAYYLVMDRIAFAVEEIEEDIFEDLPEDVPMRLGKIRKESVALRRAVWPLREAFDHLGRYDGTLMTEETAKLFSDVRDHANQIAEVNEILREAVSANMDTYISLVGMRQNEVMRVLTLVATIFIPLTFIVGIYGMNFEDMPELSEPLGYPTVWVVMVGTAVGLTLYFRRKGWL